MQIDNLDQAWPSEDLEEVLECPVCASNSGTLELEGVKDWSFRCAPGSWSYWRCQACRSLYLNPRPTLASIGRAYGSYYTHEAPAPRTGLIQRALEKLRNECAFHWLGIDVSPRIHLRSTVLLSLLRPFLKHPFPLDELNKLPPGSLLDVGCGNGELMLMATAMGQQVKGIEIDPAAVKAATARGLQVRQGSFEVLREYPSQFDYVICSHVIEHIHHPRELLELLIGAVKPGGHIFLAWPNPDSLVLKLFGIHWRGLETPRHLALISRTAISDMLSALSITHIEFRPSADHTFGESWKIRYRHLGFTIKVLNKLILSLTSMRGPTPSQDFITLHIHRPLVAEEGNRE